MKMKDIDAYMKKVYYEVNTKLNFPIGRPTRQEREQTIYALYERGFFNLKDSIDFVSKKLFCSTSTVYRYIALAVKKITIKIIFAFIIYLMYNYFLIFTFFIF